jgi:hypothetical protein
VRTFTFLLACLMLNCQPTVTNQSATNTSHADVIDGRPPMATPTRNNPYEIVACKGDIRIVLVEYSAQDDESPWAMHQLQWGCVSLPQDGRLRCVTYGTRGQLRRGFFRIPRNWNEL